MKSLKLIANGSLEGGNPSRGLSIIQIVERIVVYAVKTIQPNIHSCPTELLSVFFCFSDIDDVEGAAWCSYLGLTHPSLLQVLRIGSQSWWKGREKSLISRLDSDNDCTSSSAKKHTFPFTIYTDKHNSTLKQSDGLKIPLIPTCSRWPRSHQQTAPSVAPHPRMQVMVGFDVVIQRLSLVATCCSPS